MRPPSAAYTSVTLNVNLTVQCIVGGHKPKQQKAFFRLDVGVIKSAVLLRSGFLCFWTQDELCLTWTVSMRGQLTL